MFYKLLDISEQGELISRYGMTPHYSWKIGEWRKTPDPGFHAAQSIVDAMSVVWLEHFKVLAIVEVGEYRVIRGNYVCPEIVSHEMKIAAAYLFPEALKEYIKTNFVQKKIGECVALQTSEDYFKSISEQERAQWEIYLQEQFKTFQRIG